MSEQKARGVIFRASAKEWDGTTLYSFKFDGQDDWFRTGERKYDQIQEGYEVEVGYEVDGRGNRQVVPGHVKLIKKGEPIPSKPKGGYKGGKGGGGRGGPQMSKEEWAEKDRTIQYQAARNAAIEMVELLIKSESIKLPAKTKAAERRVVIDGLVDEYTAKFFEDTAGRSAVTRASDERDAPESLEDDVAQTESEWDGDDEGGEASEWD